MALDQKDKKYIDKTLGRYVKIVGEDFHSQIDPVIDMQQEQGKKIDSLFEMVAKNTEDSEMMKIMLLKNTKNLAKSTEDITIIKSDISFIKRELKQKVDQDEFNALEKRVLFLEKKFKRA